MSCIKIGETKHIRVSKTKFERVLFLAISIIVLLSMIVNTNYNIKYNEKLKENQEYVKLLEQHDAELQAWRNSVDYPQVVVRVVSDQEIEAYNMVCAIGTNMEKKVFGYDVSYVLKVITAEAGAHENEEDINGVTQTIYNAIQRYKNIEGITYTPEQIIYKDKYCGPANYISYAAKRAFIHVFIEGGTYEKYGDSVIFYNPKVLGHSNVTHEKFTFEYETATGVRFFSK